MGKKAVIYGAGEYGQKVFRFLSDIGVPIRCFCQTYAEKGTELLGIPVVSFNDLLDTKEKLVFFLAIANKEIREQIRIRIQRFFLDKASIIDYSNILPSSYFQNNKGGYCNLCNSNIENFIPGGLQGVENVRLFQEHHIIGGGHRKHYLCPVCGGVDRERWLVWALSRYTTIFDDGCRVLHFAPEEMITKFIVANPNCDYYSGDIVLSKAMHKIDIMDIPYKDGLFDYVIMNHVLEHICDMEQAMFEVKRVMKRDGKLILSFPICTDQDTLEHPDIVTDEGRLEYYGQKDHMRLFGRDYKTIIAAFGFNVSVYTPKAHCSLYEIEHYGFIEDDVLMICSLV